MKRFCFLGSSPSFVLFFSTCLWQLCCTLQPKGHSEQHCQNTSQLCDWPWPQDSTCMPLPICGQLGETCCDIAKLNSTVVKGAGVRGHRYGKCRWHALCVCYVHGEGEQAASRQKKTCAVGYHLFLEVNRKKWMYGKQWYHSTVIYWIKSAR